MCEKTPLWFNEKKIDSKNAMIILPMFNDKNMLIAIHFSLFLLPKKDQIVTWKSNVAGRKEKSCL